MTEPSERLKAVYALRAADPAVRRREHYDDPAQVFLRQTREREMLRLLRHRNVDLADATVLDVGCGNGDWLRGLLTYGAMPERLHGIELLPERVERARRLGLGIDIRQGSAEQLPYPHETFDIVHQSTVFSSILEDAPRQRIADEMWRVLRPAGVVLWYDFWINVANRATRGLRRQDIRRLFPYGHAVFRRVTLAPPVARLVAAWSPLIAAVLDALPFLRTHYLVLIRKGDA